MKAKVYKASDAKAARHEESWGGISWLASRDIGNAENVTFGRLTLKRGAVTGRHTHRTTEEVVYVLAGEIEHSLDKETVRLAAGDTLVVPPHVFHNLKSVGSVDAEVLVAFPTGARDNEPESANAASQTAVKGRASAPVSRGKRIDEPWGSLTWLAAKAAGNAEGITFGRVVIKRGQSNPRHAHNNCEEVLYLLSGELDHTVGGETVHLAAGDTLGLPARVFHNAKSVGTVDADMIVVYPSGTRDFVKEQ
jgi:quercetin dioxygenase-like cupin family protein